MSLSIASTVRGLIVAVIAVGMTNASQAGSIKFNDWKYNTNPDVEYRIKIYGVQNTMPSTPVLLGTHQNVANPGGAPFNAYEYQGTNTNAMMMTVHQWYCNDIFAYPGTYMIYCYAECRSSLLPNDPWVYAGPVTFTSNP